ncbi:transporter substrate-binding domain-containing protein [Neorhizobium lilium]|uniref:Transporter substrate-binding domain-containing protein n=1 Tax=Neorhizobium lilium TaxID=2503024 RepID=A0A3S3RI55_9HYPH|nr:transporter substrate-binding domain-containing protein [Neorhizobium lilium]RWX78627.1 transporter substrate-binding domain-containing protein [Neorhizobium lilium]
MKEALLLFAGLGVANCAFAQQSITFSTESYPPFSYRDSDGSYKGIGVEQVAIIMRDVGPPYTLEIMPWARAITLAETREWHCVFAAARTPERETRFKWVVPLYIDRSILVRHAGSNVHAGTLDEARQFTLGTHREDYTAQILKSLGFPKIDLSADIDTTLRKLLGDRIDMMPMSESVYDKLKTDGNPIEKVIVLTEQQLGIACNRNIPDDIIARMQSNLTKMIADGTQRAVEKKYGINRSQ